jgi:hypothetical protein|tara:strand:- start:837 stop:1220 length:384 start_codon:yes stop_codon:yes gene_type:complete
MAKPKIRKHLYWHPLAQILLERGLMPKYCAQAIKTVYPEADITGRHIGAYKRRLITDGQLEKNMPKLISPNEAAQLIAGMVGEDDKFIYQCAVGSAKRTLKCFEYKMSGALIEHTEELEGWLTKIQA